MRPIIAIEMQFEEGRGFFLPRAYDELFERAGARMVHVQPDMPAERLADLLASCDGFVIPGGDDIDANLYGQEPIPDAMPPVRVRDEFEPLALQAVLERGMPFFGICRGMQMLNIVCGGTLAQRVENEALHWQDANPHAPAHDITFCADSLLGEALRMPSAQVNSLHRQAVDRIGEGIVIEAVAPDGTIEALRFTASPFALGVQWHPELQPENPVNQALVSRFVHACAANGTKNPVTCSKRAEPKDPSAVCLLAGSFDSLRSLRMTWRGASLAWGYVEGRRSTGME